jgi:hypothetical protein
MKYFFFYIPLFLLLPCCDKHGDEPALRTVIAYIAADNDLSADALDDVEEMQRGFSASGVHLVAFIDPADEPPYLLELSPNGSARLKTYAELNSCDAAQMGQTLSEIIGMYPAEGYGLILWSHGTSWLPANHLLKSFGQDGGRQMNIPELAEALPLKLDFILLDACLMGAVEVAYELREKADFIVASSAEIIQKGFPYDVIIPELTSRNPDLKRVAEIYFDYYRQLPGMLQSATISLVDARELEKLAAVTRMLISESLQQPDMDAFDRMSVQRLDRYSEQYVFDFGDFISKAFPEADKSELTSQLNKTVLYKAHTPSFMKEYDIATYSGLSSYIFSSARSDLNTYYRRLSWYGASGYAILF